MEEDSLVELPDAVDDAQAAALGVVGITAALALDRRGSRTASACWCWRHGCRRPGGVQLARARGAGRVVAAGRNRDGLARALSSAPTPRSP